ncbi:MarR family winged helix-turn-helix transcriptional regulator [Pseudonocardia sp.]|uniref:MarR family winged helix-turn-helix transcriptional regulator n=1 Tax=Pseudonocardia sp. TaxID=60912 RepID=UPI003D13512A
MPAEAAGSAGPTEPSGPGPDGAPERPTYDPAAPDRVDRVEAGWRRERPDIDVGSVGIVTRIWRIGRHLDRHRKERLDAFGTDRVALDVLAMLRRAGPPYRRTAGELMRSALITSGGMSQRLERLESAGLISRQMHPEDRRKVEVELTPAGMALVDEVLGDLMATESKLLGVLDADEQAELRALLKKLLSRFE